LMGGAGNAKRGGCRAAGFSRAQAALPQGACAIAASRPKE